MKQPDTALLPARVLSPLAVALLASAAAACGGGGGAKDAHEFEAPEARPDGWRCQSEDEIKCVAGVLNYCEQDGEFLVQLERDCVAEGLRCVEQPPLGCVVCMPGERKCEGQDIWACDDDAQGWTLAGACDAREGEICVAGRCVNGCENAAQEKSNVGCEYLAVDLDNAMINFGLDASSQQFAVIVSNTSPIEAYVTVERNDAAPGEEPAIVTVDELVVQPLELDVIPLDRREVDGSTPAGLDDGTGSALTSRAYRIRSTAPIVAYQFNPLENVNVFSNDASTLIPSTACGTRYLVHGWPQTIAETATPATNMGDDLRAFIAVVGIEADTRVTVTLPLDDRLRVLGDGGAIPAMIGGDTFETTIGPFDVLNLETAGFNADFTGTLVAADKPVVVYSGSEASDVPAFDDLTTRLCCADHLEEQLIAIDRNGRNYVAAVTPRRTAAVKLAGGDVTVHEEKEYFKLLGLYDDTVVRTTLPTPDDVLNLAKGQSVVLETTVDFVVKATRPLSLGQFVASQQVTGIANSLPGGDPAFILVPPVEQWREQYIFLTPSLYAFDFIIIAHSPAASILLDGRPFPPTCRTAPVAGAESEYAVTRCQLSFPEIVEGTPPDNILPGEQNDGVHEIASDVPVGVVVYGFDNFVSYGYPGGTDLHEIE